MKIVVYPAPVLLKEAEPVTEITAEIRSIAKEMVETLQKAKGLGLAAPQVNISKQIIVVNPTAEPGHEEVYINPVITKKKGRIVQEEGCLSFPGIFIQVPRAKWIQVSALKLSGEQITLEIQDMEARVFQHEIDHLHGHVFASKVQPAEEIMVKRKLREMEVAWAKQGKNTNFVAPREGQL